MDIRKAYVANKNRYDSMEYRKAGESGLYLPAISLGLWHNFGERNSQEQMQDILREAFDLGITHFDLANNYGPPYGEAERNFGILYQRDFRPYREELLISTKAGYDMWEGPYGNGGSRKYLLTSCDASLKRMQLDYVDIFYHHRMDPDTPLMETMLALLQIVQSGKAIYAGISNYDGETMKKTVEIAKEIRLPLVINQNRYSILDRKVEENGLKTAAKEEGMGLICFSPLAQGLLSNRYVEGIPEDSRMMKDGRYLHKEDFTEEKRQMLAKLLKIAGERGQSLSEMALSWVLRDKSTTSVLVGVSKKEQLWENVKALENTCFTAEEEEAIRMATAL